MTRWLTLLLLACACGETDREDAPIYTTQSTLDVVMETSAREYARVEIVGGSGYLELCNSTAEERARRRQCVLLEPNQRACLWDDRGARLVIETTDAYSLRKPYPRNCPGAWDRP